LATGFEIQGSNCVPVVKLVLQEDGLQVLEIVFTVKKNTHTRNVFGYVHCQKKLNFQRDEKFSIACTVRKDALLNPK
jgi:hypothetical protein